MPCRIYNWRSPLPGLAFFFPLNLYFCLYVATNQYRHRFQYSSISGVSAQTALGSTLLHLTTDFCELSLYWYQRFEQPAMPELAEKNSPESNISSTEPVAGLKNGTKLRSDSPRVVHPSGRSGHGRGMQILRGIAFAVYFSSCCFVLVFSDIWSLEYQRDVLSNQRRGA